MKKDKRIKKWGFLISLLLLVLLPFKVKADTVVSITGNDSASPGDTLRYAIEISSDDEEEIINAFKAGVSFDSNILTFTAIEPSTGWTGTTDGGNSGKEVEFKNSSGVNGKVVVANLVFKVKNDAKATSATISLVAPKYSIKSEDGVTTSKDFTTLNNKTLNVKSSDNTLSELKINDKKVENFSPTVYEYKIDVESTVASAKINATTNSGKATLKKDYGNRTVSLNYGSNTFKIVVISESNVERTYTITINREDTRSTDTTLSSISVDGVVIPNFKSSTYKYTVKKYKVESVDIIGIAHDDLAMVKVNPPKEVIIGLNTYEIVVTSENGDTATYSVIIENVDTAINKRLKTLSIKGYDIDFDRNNYRYEIMYNKEKFKELHVYFSTESGSDEVTASLTPNINEDEDALKKLKVGDEITIAITGIDGETTEYTIVVVKDNRISFFLVFELLLMAIIIAIIIVIAVQRKKGNKKRGKSAYKTKVVTPEKKEEIVSKTTRSESAVTIVEGKKKKKRFSIYEEEELTPEDEDDDTKEFNEQELK